MSDSFFKIKRGANVGSQASDPAGGETGDFYFNSVLNTLRVYVNGAWRSAVMDTDGQTLTNKILTSPVLNTPDINAGTADSLTSLSVRDTSAAFDVTVTATSSPALTAGRTLTVDVNNAGRTVDLAGNLAIAGDLSTIGAFPIALTATASTAVTLPVSGTLATLAGSEALTGKTIDGDLNTVQDLPITALKTNLTDASKFLVRDAAGVPTSATKAVPAGTVVGTSDTQTLSSKDLVAGSTRVVDGTDSTKKIAFDVSGATTGTTTNLIAAQTAGRSLSLPDITDTLVSKSSTDTLANKKLKNDTTEFVDPTDTTKKISFNTASTISGGSTVLSAAATASGRTLSLPDATTTLVGTNVAQVLTAKDIDGGTASNTSRITIPKDTLANLTALTRKAGTVVYATDTAKTYYDNGTVLAPISSGGLGGWAISTVYAVGDVVTYSKNAYICVVAHTSNGTSIETDISGGKWRFLNTPAVGQNYVLVGSNFEDNDVAGWTTAHTTLSSLIPNQVSGSWTAATNKALSIESSAPLSGKYSLKEVQSTGASTAGDMIVSQAYNIDIIDQAKMLTVTFAYQPSVSPTNLTWSGLSTNTKQIYIYDVTNSAWIQPTGVYDMTQSSLVGKAAAQFQTPYNMTQFRIAIIDVNASAGTYTMLYDDFSVSPQTVVKGAPVTDYAAISGVTFTNLPVTSIQAFSRRVGDSEEYVVSATATGAATGTVTLNMPSGRTMDLSKLSTSDDVVGHAAMVDASAGILYSAPIMYNTTTTVIVWTNGDGSPWNATHPVGPWASPDRVTFTFKVPILGWSSGVAMSSEAGTRLISASIRKSSALSISDSTWTAISAWTTVDEDRTSSFNSSTGEFTLPESGPYTVHGVLSFASNSTGLRGVRVMLDGVEKSEIIVPTASGNYVGVPYSFKVIGNGGQKITIEGFQTSGGALNTQANANTNQLNISKLQSPQSIAAESTVAARYTTNAGQSIANAASPVVDFEDIVFDDRGSVTTGASWKFTAPISGKYDVTTMLTYASDTFTAAGVVELILYKSGSSYAYLDKHYTEVTGTREVVVKGHASVRLLAGEYIHIQTGHSESAARLLRSSSGQLFNYIDIIRTGQY